MVGQLVRAKSPGFVFATQVLMISESISLTELLPEARSTASSRTRSVHPSATGTQRQSQGSKQQFSPGSHQRDRGGDLLPTQLTVVVLITSDMCTGCSVEMIRQAPRRWMNCFLPSHINQCCLSPRDEGKMATSPTCPSETEETSFAYLCDGRIRMLPPGQRGSKESTSPQAHEAASVDIFTLNALLRQPSTRDPSRRAYHRNTPCCSVGLARSQGQQQEACRGQRPPDARHITVWRRRGIEMLITSVQFRGVFGALCPLMQT